MGLTLGHWLLQFRSTISVSTHRSMSLSTDGLIGLILVSLVGFSVAAQSITLDDVRAQMAAGQGQAALAGVETFLKDNPGHAQARFLKGIVLTEQERTVEAIEVFSAIAADFPGLPESHNNLAVLYASSGDYVKARDALLMAINTHPSYATAHENLGDVYAKMAGLAYDRALQLDTENVSVKAKLALMHDLVSAVQQPAQTNTVVATTAAPAVAVAVQETTEPATATASKSDDSAVLTALEAWASAWSAQDVGAYLNAYSGVFLLETGVATNGVGGSAPQPIGSPEFYQD